MDKHFGLVMMNVVLGGILIGTASCHRKNEPAAPAPEKPVLSQTDKNFMSQAEANNRQERDIAAVVKQRTRNDNVRKYADTLVTDYSAALQKLAGLTGKYGMEMQTISDRQPAAIKEFQAMAPRTLDKQFLTLMVQDHQRAIGLFQEETRSAQANDVREYASDTLPTLESHLKEAEELQAKVEHTHRR